ncbi:site-specific tyrosine recombinase/integron integrase [Patescibacteria group bacterium]
MKILKEFLEYLEIERGRSPKTIINYEHYLNRFFEFSKISSPKDITDECVRKYRLWLNRLTNESGKSISRNTQNYHLIALRSFLKYLAKRNIKTLAAEKIDLAKLPVRDIDLPELDDFYRFLNSPEGNSTQSLRDRAILKVFFSTGLRVSELVALNRDSIDLKRDEFSVRGKGGKIRLVFLSQEAKDTLTDYLSSRADIEDALFVGIQKNPGRLTSRQVERMIKKYAIKAGIVKKVTPHTLRHLFATDLLMNGADLRSVQALLGHASIATTQIYTHLTDKQLREVHKTFHSRRK